MAAPDPLTLVRRLMARDRFAAAIGAKLVEVREGYARVQLRLRPEHLNGVGVVQGGAVFTAADFAFAAACNSHGTVAVGLDTSMTFVRGPTGGVLVAESREVSCSRRVSVCEVRVTDDAGALVAVFRGTAFRKEESIATLLAARPGRTTDAPSRAARRGETARARAAAPRSRRRAAAVSAGRPAAAGSAARTVRS